MFKEKDLLINVPEIRKNIKEKHKKFINNFGVQAEKVIAEQRLKSDLVMARITRIIDCFKNEDIINIYNFSDQSPLKKLSIKKEGYDNYIVITTNGNIVLMEGFGFGKDINNFASDYTRLATKRFDDIHNKKYDWTKFADELLDFIHLVIYELKEAAESKIDGMFGEN